MLKRGLTLIELLIVVSIIAILAGISMENIQGAKIRAQISRNKADFHAIRVAVESYATDNNNYPRMAHFNFYKDEHLDKIDNIKVRGLLSNVISTPIAYLTSARLKDPFMEKAEKAPLDEQFYTYQVIDEYINKNPQSAFWKNAKSYYGSWRVGGVGPDQRFDHNFANSAQLPYDPTNGLISLGNIWSAHQNLSGLPPSKILGKH